MNCKTCNTTMTCIIGNYWQCANCESTSNDQVYTDTCTAGISTPVDFSEEALQALKDAIKGTKTYPTYYTSYGEKYELLKANSNGKHLVRYTAPQQPPVYAWVCADEFIKWVNRGSIVPADSMTAF